MGTRVGRLTALGISKLTKEGLYNDGQGLYLQIGKGNARSWIYRYQVNGKQRTLGLGSAHVVTLKMARDRAAEARLQRATGIDPVAAKKAVDAPQAKKSKSFEEVAAEYVAGHEVAWTRRHWEQWTSSLRNDVYPLIGSMPVHDVDVAAVLRVLQPIWNEKPVTANRIRNRIELILDAAKAKGLRDGDNPGRWRGHLDKLLPSVRKVHRVEHFEAMRYEAVPAFMERLRQEQSRNARALELAILTATRSNEVLGIVPDEVTSDVWTIPAERMKGRREHRIPLAVRALDIIQDVCTGRKLGIDALRRQLQRMDCPYDVHGFRSAFKDWAEETTSHPNAVIEMALAHVVGNATENAYRRGDLFIKRRALMADWDAFCGGVKPGEEP